MLSMVASLVVLNGLMLTKTEAAQRRGRNWDGYPKLGGSFELRQTALNAGYNEGSEEGRRDHGKRTIKPYGDFKSYKNADQDYSSKLGSRDLYQRYFRMAFESGYETENPSSAGNRDRDQTMAITIGVENIGDEIGVDMVATAALANCAKLR